ncbi:MAG: hypothetical protein ACRBHB_03070 [Arenicella sp.]
MSVDWSQYNLQQLRDCAVQSYRSGGGSRPDVLVIDIDGEQAVLKDHNRMDKWFALLVGPLLVWRETKALKKLHHLQGVPALLAVPDRRAVLMEHIKAEQVVSLKDEHINWADYFIKLRQLIDDMHLAGVAHGDLRSPTNALIDASGRAVVVDLVASLHRGRSFNVVQNTLFKKLSLVDLSAITKLKKRLAPDLLGENELESEQIAGKTGLYARALGQKIRTISRRLFSDK